MTKRLKMTVTGDAIDMALLFTAILGHNVTLAGAKDYTSNPSLRAYSERLAGLLERMVVCPAQGDTRTVPETKRGSDGRSGPKAPIAARRARAKEGMDAAQAPALPITVPGMSKTPDAARRVRAKAEMDAAQIREEKARARALRARDI